MANEQQQQTRMVLAWQWEHLTEPAWWFETARAYLHASLHLFEEMERNEFSFTLHTARAAASLFEHAVELFLKGAIVKSSGSVDMTHHLDQLYGRYRNLYSAKRYEFTGTIEDVVHEHPHQPHNEFMRYPVDRCGRINHASVHFRLDIWVAELRKFRDDFERLIPLFVSG